MNPSVTVATVTSRRFEEHHRAIDITVSTIPFPVKRLFIAHQPWDIKDFNRYMLREFADMIDTDFVITVHWDGYAIRRDLWTNNFLKYDYVGAPWPVHALHNFRHDPAYNRVGNGGFSIRSKKWLMIAKTLQGFNGENEDVFTCKMNPSQFTRQGCRFAPLELAQRFSWELPTEGYPEPGRSFGFHGIGAMQKLGIPIT